MRVAFASLDEGGMAFEVEAPTPIRVLAGIERAAESQGSGRVDLAEDLAFEVEECLECLENGREYVRMDFSSPESNFRIRVITL